MAADNQDLGTQIARAAGRFSSDKALRKRVFRAGVSGASATFGAVSRVLRRLWHEMTGFLFLCLAVIGGAEVMRKWNTHETGKLAVAAAFAAMFGYFGVSSFWRAKRQNPTQRLKDTKVHKGK